MHYDNQGRRGCSLSELCLGTMTFGGKGFWEFPPVNRDRLPRVLEALRAVASEADVSVARVALAWKLTRPFVTSAIFGAKTREQLLDNLAAAEVRLIAEQVKRLDDASALASEYPGWMLELQNSEPRGVVAK